MQLEGKIIQGSLTRAIDTVQVPEREGVSFSKRLDVSLVELCRKMNVPLPIWLKKNTHEFVRFRQTMFFAGQYTEDVPFDQFQIKLMDDVHA